MCSLLVLALTACDNDVHDGEYPLPAGQGAIVVGLQSGSTPDCLTLYVFNDNGAVAVRKDYTDPRSLASEYTPVGTGAYTVVVVANVPADVLPQQTTVSDLTDWLAENSAAYPDMLTAGTQTDVAEGEVKRLLLTLQGGTGGIDLSTVRLLLTVPGKEMPPYSSKGRTRATSEEDTYRLRCVAEVYRQGTSTRVHRHVQLCTPQADGTYPAELLLQPGDYDIRLWADWVTDGTTNDKYYDASDLTQVNILTTDYVANGQTDEKDAYYATPSASVTNETTDVNVDLIRPFARYRLVATDVEAYENLRAGGENLPPIEDLRVCVAYENFFPTGFNVEHGWPTDSQTGVAYSSHPVVADGYSADEARQVGADFILTGTDDGNASITVTMTDSRTGEVVSRLTGIPFPYRRGYLTTVTGTFLTAGLTPGGVHLDTSWENENIVDFQP